MLEMGQYAYVGMTIQILYSFETNMQDEEISSEYKNLLNLDSSENM